MLADAEGRLKEHARNWGVRIMRELATKTSLLAFGMQGTRYVVIKVARTNGDEWNAGSIAAAFHGRGMVDVLIHTPGAMLMEWVIPGNSLVYMAADDDDDATRIIARMIRTMQPTTPIPGAATAEQWGAAFDRYLDTSDDAIPAALVTEARDRYFQLCSTQKERLLLHGDLQHYNIISGGSGNWSVIDPKGVVAEMEFEIAPALRNPLSHPQLFATPELVSNRIAIFAAELSLDAARLTEWAFAQAILSAIWGHEDDGAIQPDNSALILAASARSLLT